MGNITIVVNKFVIIIKTEKRGRSSGFFIYEMRYGSTHKIRTRVGQL